MRKIVRKSALAITEQPAVYLLCADGQTYTDYNMIHSCCCDIRRVRLTQKNGWLKHAPKRAGNRSLNNGASRPDGDPQSLRDSD